MIRRLALLALVWIIICLETGAQVADILSATSLDSCLCGFFDNYRRDYRTNMPVALDSLWVDDSCRVIHVYAKEGFASQVFTPAKVSDAYEEARRCLPDTYSGYRLRLYGFGREISELIPNAYRQDKDSSRLWLMAVPEVNEWTRNMSRPISPVKGLQGCHLTVWPSHGRYFDNAKKKWRWQRPNLWCTTEDMFTRSIVVPFLLPMLESAGAVAYCPRERDWHEEELLGKVVPDSGSFVPVFPQAGDYAVYVRYIAEGNPTSGAIYTVRHGGIDTRIRVNQQMGAGTWVYLGTFRFGEGENSDNSLTLSGRTEDDKVVLVSEVRIGGGMGSIERGGKTSGMPRYLEGSRYYAEYAGFPQYVYDTKDGNNDYADDINVRSNALNYLAGGSCYLPDTTGLGVPMELSLAVHSDAGWFKENKPFGTLAIYTINGDSGADSLRSGVSRMANSDLACLVQDNICRDLTSALGTEWPHREIYNRNYSESRKPEVPSIILETMSHQHFQDMLYGHDPNFKMLYARSVYKAIVRFVAAQHGRDYVIQPLPITHFKAEAQDSAVMLSWQPQADSLEPTAMPDSYIIYCAREDGDFDNGTLVSGGRCSITIPVEKDVLYRFKVTACNEGGESWPSETLAALCAGKEQDRVLIVNAFTRLSAPAVISTTDELGFDIKHDIGVPYVNTAEYCGAQKGFLRANIGKTSDDGLGFSSSELEGQVIAGNDFNYPYIHAQAIRNDNHTRSISSCSVDALDSVPDYNLLDIIMGLQKDDGSNAQRVMKYKTYTPQLQQTITGYLSAGGAVVVSGAYVGRDMQLPDEQIFTSSTLGYTFEKAAKEHKLQLGNTHCTLVDDWNPNRYAVQSVDILSPTDRSEPFMEYHNGRCAATATDNAVVMGFPLEAVTDAADRQIIMNRVIQKLLYSF